MVRLTRAQRQERTRAAVLAAARDEFAGRGYADAKIDRIAERAELTRGAVYSNFPSKRALYLAVLLDSMEPAARRQAPAASGLGEVLGAFARIWLDRLPLIGDTPADGRLRLRSLAGVFDDEPGRSVMPQVAKLEAVLLGLAMESRIPLPVRRVRLAELVLTLLDGAGHLAETAPGFGDPFDLARACRHLAGLDLEDTWDPPHLSYAVPAQLVQEAWEPPDGPRDALTGGLAGLDADGVVVVLGTLRLEAAEEAVRAARFGDRITVAVVTDDPAETGRLVRLRVNDLTACLRPVLGQDVWPDLRLVLDEERIIASAAGIADPGDATEAAVRVRKGEIVARALGRGAAHSVASADHRPSSGPVEEAER